jgi:hypothetical protein
MVASSLASRREGGGNTDVGGGLVVAAWTSKTGNLARVGDLIDDERWLDAGLGHELVRTGGRPP